MMVIMLIRVALRAIYHHAIRSILTLLGIVIGIAGIITISAIGKGAAQRAREQFLAYGSKSIDISAGNFMAPSTKPVKSFTVDDIAMIRGQCKAVQAVSPELYQQNVMIEYQGDTAMTAVTGINEQWPQIFDRQMALGYFFNQEHLASKENVVILNKELAERFFQGSDPCGARIRIDRIPFSVIGVLAPPKIKGKWDGIHTPPIFIPASTYQKYYGPQIWRVCMSTYEDAQVPQVVRQLEKIFRAAHDLVPGEPNDFVIFDNQTFAQEAEKASHAVGIFALIAALIALLVGGIGVMNIMLVAVKERTKEIGIKLALGATQNMIRIQFLIEAIVICVLGGLLGVLFGVGLTYLLKVIFGMPAILQVGPVAISFVVTVLIGLIFGFYPAEIAARLKPVEALIER